VGIYIGVCGGVYTCMWVYVFVYVGVYTRVCGHVWWGAIGQIHSVYMCRYISSCMVYVKEYGVCEGVYDGAYVVFAGNAAVAGSKHSV